MGQQLAGRAGQGAASGRAQPQLAPGPGVAQRHGHDPGGCGVAPDRGGRQDADAYLLPNQLAQTLGVRQLHAHAQCAAREKGLSFGIGLFQPQCLLQQQLLQGRVTRQAYPVFMHEIGQGQAGMPGQRMVGCEHGHQLIGAPHAALQAGQWWRLVCIPGSHAQIAQALAQAVQNLDTGAFLQLQRDLRVLQQKAANSQRQVLAHGRGIAAQPDLTGQACTELPHGPAQLLHLGQHLARMLAQRMTSRRWRYPARLALQQGAAQLLLHAAHAFAGRGQRDVRERRGSRHGAAVQDMHE